MKKYRAVYVVTVTNREHRFFMIDDVCTSKAQAERRIEELKRQEELAFLKIGFTHFGYTTRYI